MTTTVPTKTSRTIIAEGTINAAGGTTRGTLDHRTAHGGGRMTIKITNGPTGPTTPATVNIMIAHDAGPTPAAGAAGSVWKTVWSFAAAAGNNAITEVPFTTEQGDMHYQIEVTGNTGQAVTCEAFLSEVTNYVTA